MVRNLLTILILAGVIVSAGMVLAGQSDPDKKPLPEIVGAEKALAGSANDFGFELFARLANETSADSNMLISPLSAITALAMTYNGAWGKTMTEMGRALRIPDMPEPVLNESFHDLTTYLAQSDPSVTLEIANSIWYDRSLPVKPDFVTTMKQSYDATVRGLVFGPGTADTINAWVAEKTHDHIQDMLSSPIDATLVMFLVNAVYFNAAWTQPFDPSVTSDADFHRPDGSTKTCRMMMSRGTLNHLDTGDFQSVEIPYGDGQYSMIVMLPGTGESVDDLSAQLTAGNWKQWTSEMSETNIALRLPKFTFSDGHGLNDALKAMGMVEAFERSADFSRMAEGGGIWIDSVLQKCFIRVDERGTEAGAATVVSMKKSLIREVTLDRPFLFAVCERTTGAVLFLGRVVDPVIESENK
jgi:serine protease inhibitor